ncbi:MAG TPA: DNA double-strand break repair nuclease NurA [Pyrinomonadaceae bacterium]|nr:DNA double-strand break repair nuclease NurA [Pyrinomonadaceae bacterium]
MLYHHLLSQALAAKREEFLRFDRAWREDVRDYVLRLGALGRESAAEVTSRLSSSKEPGAIPSDELDRAGSVVVPFGRRWRSHEEARRWAVDVLEDRVTFAADGSQLVPGRDLSLPVAAVQVAWFENWHTRGGKYVKDARCDILSPGELLEEYDNRSAADTVVSLRRFQLETRVIAEWVESKRGWRERKERTPVAFFDGTLIVSIALPKTKLQDAYVAAVVDLVKLSRDAEVPVVGFVDQSYARDLVWLLDTLDARAAGRRSHSLFDTQLLSAAVEGERPVLDEWGDRTIFCYCVRKNSSDAFRDERTNQPLVGFTYLQTTGEGQPARLDVPAWIYEAGLLDDVVETVRAECVSGLGYPYSIQAADEAAVIQGNDRTQFLRAVQEFAESESLPFGVSRKAASKVRRR